MPTKLSQLYCPVYSLPVISLEGQKPSPLSVDAHSTLRKITYIPALLTSKLVGKQDLQCKFFNKVKVFKKVKTQNKVKI